MSAKHTPGPWGQVGRGRDCFVTVPLRSIYCERLGYSVAFVSHDRGGEPEANARLIAAAPELLEALRDCEALLAYQHANGANVLKVLNKAGDAISKATGEGA